MAKVRLGFYTVENENGFYVMRTLKNCCRFNPFEMLKWGMSGVLYYGKC